MRSLSIPFHVGERVEGFPTPHGAEVLDVALPEGTRQDRMITLFREVAARVASGDVSLVYAGDCMAPLGVLAGLARRGVTPFIVWLDAHGDFNTWETTPSGYIGGMPLAMLAGLGEQTIVRALGLSPLDARRVVLADARDVDPEEGVALGGSGVVLSSVEEIVRRVPEGVPVYVHLDVDVVSPAEMPALRFPAAGGPALAAVEAALDELSRSRPIVCATVACTWDPAGAGASGAVAATERLVRSLMG